LTRREKMWVIARYGTRAQAAIRHALANPDLSTVVVGVTGLEQLDEALAAVQAGPPLPGAALDEVEGCCQEGF